MELLYKSEVVAIFFDIKKNMLVQKWKEKHAERIPGGDLKTKTLLFYKSTEIEKILGIHTSRDIEAKLQLMLLQWYPKQIPMA